jgi:hypothetical protein
MHSVDLRLDRAREYVRTPVYGSVYVRVLISYYLAIK